MKLIDYFKRLHAWWLRRERAKIAARLATHQPHNPEVQSAIEAQQAVLAQANYRPIDYRETLALIRGEDFWPEYLGDDE